MKTLSLLSLAMLISVASYAADRVDGTIVFDNGKSIQVELILPTGWFGGDPSTEAMQKGVRFIDASGKKQRLKANHAKEFYFNYGGRNYRMVSQKFGNGIFSPSRVFMLQLIDGPVKMFEHISTRTTSSGPNMAMSHTTTVYRYLLQRNDEQLFEPRMFSFKKDMSRYFSDCPTLVEMIEGKEFKRRDLDEIVMFYNERCK